MQMNTELLPCPFGKDCQLLTKHLGTYVACPEHTSWMIRNEWNTRTPSAEVVALQQDNDHLTKMVNAYGGFHERSKREIEISQALEDTPINERSSEDNAIAELLALIDAGRGVLWKHQEELLTLKVEKERLVGALNNIAGYCESDIAMCAGDIRVVHDMAKDALYHPNLNQSNLMEKVQECVHDLDCLMARYTELHNHYKSCAVNPNRESQDLMADFIEAKAIATVAIETLRTTFNVK